MKRKKVGKAIATLLLIVLIPFMGYLLYTYFYGGTKEDKIDPTVGVFLNKQVGEEVAVGDVLCTLYYNRIQDAFNIADAFEIEEE